MQSNPLRRLTFASLAVLVAASMLVPTVAAQGATSLSLGTPELSSSAPLVPDTGIMTVDIPWTYTISTVGLFATGAVTTSTTLLWEDPTCDRNGVLITGALAETIVLSSGATAPESSYTGTSTFTITATQDAPGETQIKCTFQAKVAAVVGTQVPETETATTTTPMVVEFLGLLSANVGGTIKQAGPQKQINYQVELTNLGNARTNVNFALSAEASGGWKPVAPTQIVLESTQQGGSEISKNVLFTVSTPFKNGWNNKEDTFQLVITPASTKDPEKVGTAVTVNVLARVRGVYVPSLEPMVLVAAVLGSALLVRMMKSDEE
jgi:hypothetical protein